MAMRLLDLFSGIGGFSYAAETLIGGYETVAFCEMDEFCQKVLKKHWPDVPIFDDVRTLDATRLGRIDICTFGFPCQPVSQAGLQKAESDDRWLWDEIIRILQVSKPKWIIAENVVGLISIQDGLLIEHCISSLEAEGYEIQPVVIPACAKNAPHRRSRIWLVGKNTTKSEQSLVNTNSFRSYKHKTTEKKSPIRRTKTSIATTSYNVANTESIHRDDNGIVRKHGEAKTQKIPRNRDGISNTQRQQPKERTETVVSKMGDLADGISTGLLRHFDREPEHIPRVTTGEKDRAKKLKALGNSIVPQVAAEILLAIRVSEESD